MKKVKDFFIILALASFAFVCLFEVASKMSNNSSVKAQSDFPSAIQDSSYFHIILDKETGEEYIMYYNEFCNEYTMCPRIKPE